jgi:hypothetical protein
MNRSNELKNGALQALAAKTLNPVKLVSKLYAEEVTGLEAQATVKRFITVIALRRVKQRLLRARQGRARQTAGSSEANSLLGGQGKT